MARMFNPPHPGEALREDVLPALGLTVSGAATRRIAPGSFAGVEWTDRDHAESCPPSRTLARNGSRRPLCRELPARAGRL